MPSPLTLTVLPHPLLCCAAFVTMYPASLGTLTTPPWLIDLLRSDASVPVRKTATMIAEIRDLLRHGGFKPSGRSKPASEYLVRASSSDGIRSINAAVDACNAVSLHSGFPISLIDVDLAVPPLSVDVASPGSRYVFNPTGQEIELGGLLCLFDGQGPCANAVKDSQRTKTHDGTVRTLSVLWGTQSLADPLVHAAKWYRTVVERLGSTVEDVTVAQG